MAASGTISGLSAAAPSPPPHLLCDPGPPRATAAPPSLPVHVGPTLLHLRLLALKDVSGVHDVKEVDGQVERDGNLLPHAEGQATGVDAHILGGERNTP